MINTLKDNTKNNTKNMESTIKMADIYIKLLSGDLYRVNINIKNGIEGLERDMVCINRNIFRYGHMTFFKEGEDNKESEENEESEEWIYNLVDGDIVCVIIS